MVQPQFSTPSRLNTFYDLIFCSAAVAKYHIKSIKCWSNHNQRMHNAPNTPSRLREYQHEVHSNQSKTFAHTNSTSYSTSTQTKIILYIINFRFIYSFATLNTCYVAVRETMTATPNDNRYYGKKTFKCIHLISFQLAKCNKFQRCQGTYATYYTLGILQSKARRERSRENSQREIST